MRETDSLTKTIWEKLTFRTGRFREWDFVWICDVHEDRVIVFVSEDYPRYKTETFHATNPDFVEQVFQAIDRAIEKRKP